MKLILSSPATAIAESVMLSSADSLELTSTGLKQSKHHLHLEQVEHRMDTSVDSLEMGSAKPVGQEPDRDSLSGAAAANWQVEAAEKRERSGSERQPEKRKKEPERKSKRMFNRYCADIKINAIRGVIKKVPNQKT